MIKREAHFIFAAFLFSITIFFFGPLNLYLPNVSFEATPLFAVSYLAVLTLGASGLIIAIGLLLPRRFREIICAFLYSLAVTAWIISYFQLYGKSDNGFFSEIAPVTANFEKIPTPLILSVLIFLMLAASYKWYKRYTTKIFTYLILVQLVSAIAGVFSGNGSALFYNNGATILNSENLYRFSSSKPNTIVLVVDAMTSEVALDLISSEESLRKKFEGFVTFKDTVSMYNSTNLAIPGLMSGTYYEGKQTLKEYYDKSFSSPLSLIELARARGFETSLSSFISYYVVGDKKGTFLNQIARVFQKGIDSNALIHSNLVEVAISHFLPSPVHERYLMALHNSGRIRSFQKELNFDFFSNFNSLLKGDSTNSTFHFYHIAGAHRPYLSDVDNPLQPLENTYANYRLHARRSIVALGGIADHLRDRHLFDNTSIIVVGDHGVPETKRTRNPAPHLMPLFMVKPANSRGPFAENSTPMSLKDAYVLIKASFDSDGLTESKVNDVVEKYTSNPESRIALTFNSLVFERHFQDNGLKLLKYAVNGRATDPDSWHFLGSIHNGLPEPTTPIEPSIGERCEAKHFMRGGREGVAISGGWGITEPSGIWAFNGESKIFIPGKRLPSGPFVLRLDREVNADNDFPIEISYESRVGVIKTVFFESTAYLPFGDILVTDEMRDPDGSLTLTLNVKNTPPGRLQEQQESTREKSYFVKAVNILPYTPLTLEKDIRLTLSGTNTGSSYLRGQWSNSQENGRWAGTNFSLLLPLDKPYTEPLSLALRTSLPQGRGAIKVNITANGEEILAMTAMPDQKLPDVIVIPAHLIRDAILLKVDFHCRTEIPMLIHDGKPRIDKCLFVESFSLNTSATYNRGGQMSFSANGADGKSLHGHWLAPDLMGRWSYGPAKIYIPLSEPWTGPMRLVFKGEGNKEGGTAGNVKLKMNGKSLPSWHLAGANSSLPHIDIPSRLMSGSHELTMEITCIDNNGKPANDKRCVFLQSLSIE